MTMQRKEVICARAAVRGLGTAVALVLALGSAACNVLDEALEVDTPSQVPAETLDDPALAHLLVSGLIADFDCALGAFVVTGGLLGDELHDATFTANRWPVPSRQVQASDSRYSTFGCTTLGVYTPISTARWSADNALTQLEAWSDAEVVDRQQKLATAAAYAGYSHILLAEMFCTAAVDLGPELSPADIFERAETRFTRAIEAAQAAGDEEILNMARVGRARTRLALGNTAGAAEDAQAVPAGFERVATASEVSDRRRNRVAQETRLNTVSVKEPYRDLTVDGQPDARVTVLDLERKGPDAQTDLWQQQKYTSDGQSLPVATWREAQLIIAEAQGGQAAVDAINVLRDFHGLPAYAGGSEAEIATQVREERRRELFLEGHRLWDIRRFDLPLFPETGTPFSKGGQYQSARCLPLPDVERASNPNL
jgi:hypothetical protein